MSNKVLLTLDQELLKQIDEEKEERGASRTRTIVHILEQHFQESREKKQIYNEWFIAEVKRGLHSLKNEPLYDHEDVMKNIDAMLEAKRMAHASKVV